MPSFLFVKTPVAARKLVLEGLTPKVGMTPLTVLGRLGPSNMQTMLATKRKRANVAKRNERAVNRKPQRKVNEIND